MKNKLDSLFFIRLFVPQAPQSSFYRRAESEIRLAIPPTQKCVCGMENSVKNMKAGEKFEKFAAGFVAVLFMLIVSFLCGLSVWITCSTYNGEHCYYGSDNPLVHLVLIALMVAVICFIKNKFKVEISDKVFTRVVVITSALLALFVLVTQYEPMDDQQAIMISAHQYIMGNYDSWQPGGYAHRWGFQNGIILIMVLFSRIFGTYNYVAVQLVNVALLMTGYYFVYKISQMFWENKLLSRLMLICFCLYFPMNLFVAFIYGTVIGFPFAMAAVYLVFRYFKDRKFWRILVAGLCMAVAILAKPNYSIYLVALGIYLVMDAIVKKKVKSIAAILAMVLIFVAGSGVCDMIVSSHTGEEAPPGVPFVMFLAMGVQEGWKAPGWENGLDEFVYRDSGWDVEVTTEAGKEYLRQFYGRVKEDPKYGIGFFVRKNTSQWINPTYECFQMFELRDTNVVVPSLVINFLNPESGLNKAVVWLLNIIQTMVFFGAVVYVACRFKKITLKEMFFAVIFIGGFIFHTFSEARCYYTLMYFILLIPYAVIGYNELSDRVLAVAKKESAFKVKPSLIATAAVLLVCVAGVFVMKDEMSSREEEHDEYRTQKYLETTVKDGDYYFVPVEMAEGSELGPYEKTI